VAVGGGGCCPVINRSIPSFKEGVQPAKPRQATQTKGNNSFPLLLTNSFKFFFKFLFVKKVNLWIFVVLIF
jgi:hypothetical protein